MGEVLEGAREGQIVGLRLRRQDVVHHPLRLLCRDTEQENTREEKRGGREGEGRGGEGEGHTFCR